MEALVRGVVDAVVIFRATGRAKASGVPFDERNAQVWRRRNGRLRRNEGFSDPADELRAAGLA